MLPHSMKDAGSIAGFPPPGYDDVLRWHKFRWRYSDLSARKLRERGYFSIGQILSDVTSLA